MPNLVISLAHTGRLAKAFAGRRHRGKLCSVKLWMALAVPNDVCRWHATGINRCPLFSRCWRDSGHAQKAASVAIRMSAFGAKPENVRCIRTLPVLSQSDISAVEKSRHSHAPTC